MLPQKQQPDFRGFQVRQVFVVQSTETWQFLAADLSFVGNLSRAGRLHDWDEAFEVAYAHLGEFFTIHSFHEVAKLDEVVEF